MFDKFIIYFFYFFLLSRFFSEKLKILPKWIDLINFPLFAILLILLIININKRIKEKDKDDVFINRIFLIFTIMFFISTILNEFRILPVASILFYVGFMEGPLLFILLNKITKNKIKLASNVDKIFFVVIVINLIVIFFLDLPEFLFTGNPDVVSGTYGYNTNQFSMLLMICGGYLIGYNYIKNYRTWFVIISQLLIFIIFYLSQFRSALPFFLFSYILMISVLYGKNIVLKIVPLMFITIVLIIFILYITEKNEKIEALKFSDWMEIISEPQKFLEYGKFKIYSIIPKMWSDEPQIMIIGTGPGNFMSRANFTFSYELFTKSKGVAPLVNSLFGISHPYFTNLHIKYIQTYIKSESILGTWQLSNPSTSYLSAISEIGIIGGISIIVLYLFIIFKSLKYFKIIAFRNRDFIPLSVALIGGTSYLFGLAFLDNYWEIARMTLPVWLLFWAVKVAASEEQIVNNKE
jgi:O-antigen ligase